VSASNLISGKLVVPQISMSNLAGLDVPHKHVEISDATGNHIIQIAKEVTHNSNFEIASLYAAPNYSSSEIVDIERSGKKYRGNWLQFKAQAGSISATQVYLSLCVDAMTNMRRGGRKRLD
jgi:hypothetical protein